MAEPQPDITALLGRAADGDASAAEQLLPMVYEELRGLAGSYFSRERSDHTLQPTAVVHEAYLRLIGSEETSWNDRAHFFRASALAMRRILVNHARDRGRQKRGGGDRGVHLPDETPGPAEVDLRIDFLALEEVLTELGEVDPRKEQVVQLRF
ncbi:MAG: ECF-type sigma factor, partial [Planctomycetota bacterium]